MGRATEAIAVYNCEKKPSKSEAVSLYPSLSPSDIDKIWVQKKKNKKANV